jgi:hypothetical protein
MVFAVGGTGCFLSSAAAIVTHQDHYLKQLAAIQADIEEDGDSDGSSAIDLTEAYRGAAGLHKLISQFTATWSAYFLGAEFPMVLVIGSTATSVYLQLRVGIVDLKTLCQLLFMIMMFLMSTALTSLLFYLPARIDQRNQRIISQANALQATLGYKGRKGITDMAYFHGFLVECDNVFAPLGIRITFSLALSLFYAGCSLVLGLSLSVIMSKVEI